MSISYGFLSTIFTIWGIDVLSKHEKIWSDKWIIVISTLYGLIYLTFVSKLMLEYIPIYAYILEIIVYIFLAYLILSKRIKLVVLIFTSMIMMASFTINPVVSGTSAITNHKLYEEVSNIIKEDESNWLVLNDLNIQGYLLASGAKVINGVNYYPDVEKWQKIDPEMKYRDIYNRYAHIEICLAEEDGYDIYASDSIIVNISPKNLKKWDVKYLFSGENIENQLKDLRHELIYEDAENGYFIYRINE